MGAGRLGFGCARLPGVLSKDDAVELLETALDSGVSHFDTAPLYGWGAAEPLLGELARRRRSEMVIVTKIGLAPPTALSRVMAKVSGNPAEARFGRFAPAQARESFEASLRALRTDQVDALLLHEIEPKHLTDELLRFLESLKRDGKAGAIGLATSPAATAALLRAHPTAFDIVQLPHGAGVDAQLPTVIHSVLTSQLDKLLERLAESKTRAQQFEEQTGVSSRDRRAIGDFLLCEAMRQNPQGVTLFSSSRPDTVRRNARLTAASAAAPIVTELLA